MGVCTSIYRERCCDKDEYSIKLFKGNKEIELDNPESIREEFYFGKNIFQINDWIYRRIAKNCGGAQDNWSYEYVEGRIFFDDLEDLVSDIEEVQKNHNLAKKLLPYPAGVYDKDTDLYDKDYFEDLERAKNILEQLIREDSKIEASSIEYYVDIG